MWDKEAGRGDTIVLARTHSCHVNVLAKGCAAAGKY